MTFAIPGLGKILASHAASGVSVGSTLLLPTSRSDHFSAKLDVS